MRSALSLFAAVALVAAAAPPSDWRRTASETVQGWTFGKPAAPLLVEYASFGCPHCGHFAADAGPAIAARVKAGKLRLAFRPFLIFPQDRAAAVLSRCVAPTRRKGFIEALFARQDAIRTALAAADADPVQRGKLFEAELKGPVPHSAAVADSAGLTTLAAAHGLTAAAATRCLASQANHAWVTAADLEARASGVTGTPTYVWRGQRLDGTLTPAQLVERLPR